jgi:hypothetical protein
LSLSRRSTPIAITGLVVFAGLLASVPVAAQWIRYPSTGVPRKADGSVDISAATPRTVDGKPDFSGIWTSDEVDPRRPDVPPNPRDVASLVKERWARNAKDDPHVRCFPDNFIRAYAMPHLLKFAHMPGLLIVLNEWNAGYRQVFMDGRPLPEDPTPSWMGYSSAKWSGDTLVVDTIGLRDDSWIDWQGSVVTESAKVREDIRRPDFGHLVIRLTVDDSKAYTKPWTVTIRERLIADAELIDEICLENERSLQQKTSAPFST